MSAFNNSFSNRCFAAFLSLLLMVPTGFGLFEYWTHDSSTDNQDWVLRALLHVLMDVVAATFALSVLGVIWAAFTPVWIGRFFRFALEHFVKGLAVLLFVILAMLAFAFLTLHGH